MSTLPGQIDVFDTNTLCGRVRLLASDRQGERLLFHSTSFIDDAAFRFPREGELVEVAFADSGNLLHVHACPELWTLDLALELVRDIEPVLAELGWHVAITGGVLFRGYSMKDLDLIVFPHAKRTPAPTDAELLKLRRGLKSAGMTIRNSRRVVQRGERWKASGDTKHVEIWTGKGRRVDVIVLS